MSEIKLKPTGGGAGSVSLKAPAATTGNADVPFVLPVADGSAGQYLKTDGSKNLSFSGGGKVLQVVQATYTTAKTIAGTSFVDTDLTCNITTTTSNSHVLVHVYHPIETSRFGDSVGTVGCTIQLLRDSTVIKPGKVSTNYLSVPEEDDYIVNNYTESFSYLDTPGGAATYTYKTQAAEVHANQGTTFNGGSATEGMSVIVLMEISQ